MWLGVIPTKGHNMTNREKHKIANHYIEITEKYMKRGAQFKPNYDEIVIDRILDLFPVDGVQIAMIFKDRLVNELNWKVNQ